MAQLALVSKTMSVKLKALFLDFLQELNFNRDHDADRNEAWNNLINYLCDIEEKANKEETSN